MPGAIDNVTAVRLDVTQQDQVDAVVKMIRESGTGLYGLVNNAGVSGGGTVLEAPVKDQTFVYTVNVEAFMHALFDEKPLRRYVVVPNEKEQEMTISTKINELVQLNQWGPYSYSRDQLVELLDKALAGETSSE